MKISCILLSAGLSQRFGSPKALAQINTETAICRLQKMLIQSVLKEIIIVLGAHSEKIKPYLLNHKKIRVVYNKNYKLGQTSSFQAGLDEVCPEATGLMLLPVDYPLITTKIINVLIKEFEKNPEKILVPCYNGRKGHPPIFPIILKKELLALTSNQGLNEIGRRYPHRMILIKMSEDAVVKTFNTTQEFKDLTNN